MQRSQAVGGSATAPQYEFLRWNYYPLFESRGNHIINKNLALLQDALSTRLIQSKQKEFVKTILLQSSANSRNISTPALISPNENRNSPEDVLFKKNGIPVAVLLEGKFNSLYKNRVTKAQQDSLAQNGGFKESTSGGRQNDCCC
jgi:hypothetical protein